jgi:hypothetical protein
MKDRDEKDIPQIIDEINEHFQKNAPEEVKKFTVEEIAVKLGIKKNILYDWVKTDSDFSDGLERLKSSQKDSPFRTGTEDDAYVDAMMIAFILLETMNRRHKTEN